MGGLDLNGEAVKRFQAKAHPILGCVDDLRRFSETCSPNPEALKYKQ